MYLVITLLLFILLIISLFYKNDANTRSAQKMVEHYTVGANDQVCKEIKSSYDISYAYKYLNRFPYYTPKMLNRYPVTYYYPYSFKKYYPTYTYIK